MTFGMQKQPPGAANRTVPVSGPKKPGPDKVQMLASTFISMLVCLPAAAATAYLLDSHVSLAEPQILMLLIIALGVADFVALVYLDGYRRRIGPMTLPALAGGTGLVLLYLIAQGVNRFFANLGYAWLYPLALLALAACYLAIFREKTTWMKIYLGVNGLALTILTCLGHADKIALPF
ncbi:MAG: hypothetical protein GC185_08280 [Alphaproteobacteria bacterium]|nr:hypothetical protein [Alphaproteobacteria bacterium]